MDQLDLRFRKFTTESLIDGGLPIKITVEGDFKQSKRKFKQLSSEIDRLRDDIISDGGRSKLGTQVENAMNQIMTNIMNRYEGSGLNEITEQLVASLEGQVPVVTEFKTKGVQAALINVSQMNIGTRPYYYDKESKAHWIRPETPKQYTYAGGTGTISATGYWAFQEFGAAGGRSFVPARAFILTLERDLHQVDKSALDFVETWINTRVKEFNAKAQRIIGT
jgi:hypothetical protein